jgi:molybdate ABC transporter permease protein
MRSYSLLITHYSLLITHYSLLITHYSLLITHYPLLITHYPLPITHYPLLITHYPLPITHYPLPITHYPLPITHYSLLITHYSLLITHPYMPPTDLSPLWISLKVSLLATAITFGLGTSAAYQMYLYRGKWRFLIEGLSIAPLILPPTVVGFVLLILLGKNGLLGQFLDRWNLGLVFTWYAAVLAAIIVSFPLMYRAALGAFEQIDTVLLDAARLEGASEPAVFWYIALPLAIPGIIAGTVLTFARALGEFGATLMLAGNIPGQTQTMPMAIYFAVEAGAIQEGWFWTMIISCISLGGIVVVNYWKV